MKVALKLRKGGAFEPLFTNVPALAPLNFPHKEWFDGNGSYFTLDRTDILKEMEDRLIIDWGASTLSWHQKALNEKPVLAIQANPKLMFNGYEELILSFDMLKEITDDPVLYESFHDALRSVYAIYLIVDTVSGQQYVGSAYGKGGLLNRWECYISTKHGGNIKMIELLNTYPDRYKSFRFSILQILPKIITSDEVIYLESLYKSKLMSIKHGLNDN